MIKGLNYIIIASHVRPHSGALSLFLWKILIQQFYTHTLLEFIWAHTIVRMWEWYFEERFGCTTHITWQWTLRFSFFFTTWTTKNWICSIIFTTTIHISTRILALIAWSLLMINFCTNTFWEPIHSLHLLAAPLYRTSLSLSLAFLLTFVTNHLAYFALRLGISLPYFENKQETASTHVNWPPFWRSWEGFAGIYGATTTLIIHFSLSVNVTR